MSFLWGLFAIFALAALIWWFASEYLKLAFIKIKWVEALLIDLFTEDYTIKSYADYLSYVLPQELTWDDAVDITSVLGFYLMVVNVVISSLLMFLLYKGMATLRFTKKYTMDTLRQQEKNNWPQITPAVNENIIDLDIHTGPWAMAMNQMQFCKTYNLLSITTVADGKAVWRAEGIKKAVLIREKANKVFVYQMGPLWQSVAKLPIHTKALFAVFAARAEHDNEAAYRMLRQFSAYYKDGRTNYNGVDELLSKYQNSKAVQRCIQKHAYVLTVMASMLELARVDGVLASADFLWLKLVDRRLWYMLNNVGRQTAFTEIAGPFAHWRTEKEMSRALKVPVIHMATEALHEAIEKTIYIDDEDAEQQA